VTARGAYREILGIRDARRLIAASAVSQLGDWLFNAALLGTVYAATGSARWVGAATICRLLPYVLLGPLGGLVADRYDRRTVLLAGDVARCLLMFALAAVVQADGPVEVVIALTALASCAGTAERPAAMALLPRLVGVARLGPANALLHTVQDLGVVVGPAIGAILLAVAPNSVAFLVNGLTFVLSAALISTLRHRVVPEAAQGDESAGFHLLQGLRTARATPYVVPLLVVIGMAELTYGAQTVQLVVYAAQRLDLGAAGYGYLLAAGGVGGVLSALVTPRLATSTRVVAVVVLTGALYCATQLAYAERGELVFALAVTLIGGAAFVACEVVAETTLARLAPAESLGRLMGVVEAVAVAAMVAGALLAPVLLARTTLRGSLWILGLAAVLTTLLSVIGLRGLDALSRRRAEALASRVAVVQRLPIVAGAPQLVVEQLASASEICPLPAGVDVVVQGAPAHAFYAVMDGRVLVRRDGAEVARLGPGDHFGERGLLDSAPRNATVTTAEPCTLLRLEGDVLLEALQTVPTMRTTLDRSNVRGRSSAPHTALVDDPAWASALS
jgi:MFS family permease